MCVCMHVYKQNTVNFIPNIKIRSKKQVPTNKINFMPDPCMNPLYSKSNSAGAYL